MLKENKNKIEKIIDILYLQDGLNYHIKYKDIKRPKLVNEKDLTEIERKYCENFKKSFLNKKRKKDNNSSNNIHSLKNKTMKINNDVINYDSSSSISENKRKEKYNKIENDSNNSEIQTKDFEREGFIYEDSPLKILNVGKIKNDNSLYCLVKWKQTNDEIRILNSLVDTKKMRKRYPNLLIDYYESKITFLDDL